jgi:hypothetical protein
MHTHTHTRTFAYAHIPLDEHVAILVPSALNRALETALPCPRRAATLHTLKGAALTPSFFVTPLSLAV